MRTLKYTDGELTLNDNGTLTAIGEYAHKSMYRLWNLEKNGIKITDALFDGIINCRIII